MNNLDFNLDRIDHIHGLMVRTEVVLFAISKGELKLFMVERDHDSPKASLVLPGGFMLQDLNLDHSATAIAAKLGFGLPALAQFGIFSQPDRDRRGRVVSAAFWGAVPAAMLRDCAGASPQFRVVRVQQQPQLTLISDGLKVVPGGDHLHIIRSAIDHLRAMVDNSTLAFHFVRERFTLLDLQQVHEAILGHELEKVSFRKRLLGRIFPDGTRLRGIDETRPTKGRPARLYHRVWDSQGHGDAASSGARVIQTSHGARQA